MAPSGQGSESPELTGTQPDASQLGSDSFGRHDKNSAKRSQIAEMKRINALNLEPTLPKADDTGRSSRITFKDALRTRGGGRGENLKVEFEQALETIKKQEESKSRKAGAVPGGSSSDSDAKGKLGKSGNGSLNPNAADFTPKTVGAQTAGAQSVSSAQAAKQTAGPVPDFAKKKKDPEMSAKTLEDIFAPFFRLAKGATPDSNSPAWPAANGPSYHEFVGKFDPSTGVPNMVQAMQAAGNGPMIQQWQQQQQQQQSQHHPQQQHQSGQQQQSQQHHHQQPQHHQQQQLQQQQHPQHHPSQQQHQQAQQQQHHSQHQQQAPQQQSQQQQQQQQHGDQNQMGQMSAPTMMMQGFMGGSQQGPQMQMYPGMYNMSGMSTGMPQGMQGGMQQQQQMPQQGAGTQPQGGMFMGQQMMMPTQAMSGQQGGQTMVPVGMVAPGQTGQNPNPMQLPMFQMGGQGGQVMMVPMMMPGTQQFMGAQQGFVPQHMQGQTGQMMGQQQM